jgi:glutamate-ammonia-ligase adenylyltransferase
MHAAHPNRSGLFDLKHDHGGMIDVEFTVQFLVLAHSHRHPQLTKNLGNIALLGMAAELGLIPADLAERCRNAYREFRRLQHSLRLNGARFARVPPEQVAAHVAAVRELWKIIPSEKP